MARFTIDGRAVEAAPGATILETALANGIDIPRLCHHPDLKPTGSCRLCLVEIDGRPAPASSCGLVAADGMVVRTRGDRLTALRRDVIDLLVSDHPLTCVTCDKNGACDLQTYAYEFGVSETSYGVELSRATRLDDNAFFVRDYQYCILCGKCTRVCDEVVGANAIEIVGRGFGARVATPFDVPMAESGCVFCGSCVQVCPTAALLPRLRVGQGRDWEFTRKRTTCGYCGVGCGIELSMRNGKIFSASGFHDAPANGEFLCVKGRYGWDFATSPDRLTTPIARREIAVARGIQPLNDAGTLPKGADEFAPISWDDALDLIADRLVEIVKRDGPNAVAGLASARCTNEENYLFQRLMRASLGTNNVDHCARLCHSSSVTGLGEAFGSGAMTNPIRDIRDADCVLITGSNTLESHPVIGYEVVRASKAGANVIVIDPRRIPMVEHATLFLQPRPGTDGYVFQAMMHAIIAEGWADEEFIGERTEGYESFAASVAAMTPEAAELASGVPADLVVQAARAFSLGERASGTSQYADPRGHATILYAMGITQRSNGTDLVRTLANLSMLTGQIGKPSTGVNPLRGQSNVQGACDVGALPNVLPGYRAVTDQTARDTAAAAWKSPSLPIDEGLTVVEMTHAAIAGTLRAIYVMGENPMLSDPNLSHVEEGLRALEFLAVQDIFFSETAALAHVVLPAASWLEKDGTFTSTERRIQMIHPALPAPGEARPDWAIVSELGRRIDARRNKHGAGGADAGSNAGIERWDFVDPSAIMDELASVTPIYGGVRHTRLNGAGLVWPCSTIDHPGTPRLHETRFTRGLGRFSAVPPGGPAETTDDEYPLYLTTGRILYHYHTGTMTRRSVGLDWREPRGYAEISADDAQNAGVRDGGPIVIRSRRGQVRTQARVTDRVPTGTLFLSFHWRESPANALTQDFRLDPIAKIPEYKVCAVRIESARERG
ncbi:MAG: formate dehydrogenase subunit alpha [Chloroflexota bacterium]|nr:MAG: formate dehydrogenase subunit alpha [Chloroflexota bacterium]